jgi:hypothetical protein
MKLMGRSKLYLRPGESRISGAVPMEEAVVTVLASSAGDTTAGLVIRNG